jgi:hypothetical protein
MEQHRPCPVDTLIVMDDRRAHWVLRRPVRLRLTDDRATRRFKMMQAVYKGVEIEMESRQEPRGMWKCDYTLITHPSGARSRTTLYLGKAEFSTKDLADEHVLQEAHAAIDRDTKGQPVEKIADPPRQVRI